MSKKNKSEGISVSELIKVEDSRDLSRDLHSKAVINTNKKAYLKAVADKKKRKESESDIDQIRNELAEVKKLLSDILKTLGSSDGNN